MEDATILFKKDTPAIKNPKHENKRLSFICQDTLKLNQQVSEE